MKLRLLMSIHLFPPNHLAGSESFCVAIAKELIKRGFEVRVYLHYKVEGDSRSFYEWEGIPVWSAHTSHQAMTELFNWADVVYSHLDFTKWSIWKAKSVGKPLVYGCHNTSEFYNDMINTNENTFVIYNAKHAADELQYKRPSMIFEPPLDLTRCVSEDKGRKYITLINLCENKGVRQFYEIAKRMPNHHFLGVQGSYSEQEYCDLPNVTFWPKQTDIRRVYEVSRIVLMPSDYESYGSVAAEALANGIPVICSPTPGLLENCGNGAQYLDRENITGYVNLIKKLDDGKHYAKWSEAGLKRTAERPNRYDELEQFLYKANAYRYEYNR